MRASSSQMGAPFHLHFYLKLLHILSRAFIHAEVLREKKKKDSPHLSCNFGFDAFRLNSLSPFPLVVVVFIFSPHSPSPSFPHRFQS